MQGLRECLAGGQFVLTAELEPPKGTGLERVLQYANALRSKVHAVNITDSPMANMRMSPIAVAHIIRRDAGLDAIFHLTCRDRNVIGLQSELLGAAALGVRTILVLTGDHPARGDHPGAEQGSMPIDAPRRATAASVTVPTLMMAHLNLRTQLKTAPAKSQGCL